MNLKLNDPRTNWKFIAIVAVFAILVSGGIIWFTQSSKPTPSQTISIPKTPTPQEQIDTSTWQTYRNDEFGFEVKYPRDWSVAERASLSTIISGAGLDEVMIYLYIDAFFYANEDKLYLDEWMQKFGVGQNVRGVPQKAQFGSYEAYKIEGESGGRFFVDIYLMDKARRIFLLSSEYSNTGDKQIVNQILSTFRFVP